MKHELNLGAAALRDALLPMTVLLACLLLAEAAVRLGWTPATIAAPSAVWQTLRQEHAALWLQAEPTIITAVYGCLIASLLALALGCLVYLFKQLETLVVTAGAVLSSIPIIAIAPVLIVWMGLSLSTRIAITTVICLFPMLVSVVQGLHAGQKNSDELFTLMAATPLQRLRLLALPAALPYIFMGLKISAPLAVLGALVAEWTGAETGLGVAMLSAMFSLQIGRLWASVLLTCALSIGAYGYVCLVERLSLDAGRRADGSEA
jgi:ABC-type nitrate/sulfonate/bicarbonate transport system permease component